MTALRAGFGKVELSGAAVGAPLMGYANREGGATAVHDPLFARALLLEHGDERVALVGLDLCGIGRDVVAAARERIASESGVPGAHVFVAASHTHSGPADDDRGCWPDGLDAPIAAAVAQAQARLAPARLGAGWGFLFGHAFNRRRFEDPVDPAVFALRVDDEAGAPLGVVYGFGCHPVVLGPDSREITADWPGVASAAIESALGADAVAVFAQGACADVNPLTGPVLERIAAAGRVVGQVEQLSYYGTAGAVDDVGDRTGGTFAEAERLGRAVAEEALHVCRGIAPQEVTRVWARPLPIPHPRPTALDASPLGDHFLPRTPPGEPLDAMLLGVDGPGVVLVGQPGEVFAATGVELRRALRAAGVPHPWVVGYANDWRAYLTPAEAYPDGGYEVDWARACGHPETLQDEIRARVLEALQSDAGPDR